MSWVPVHCVQPHLTHPDVLLLVHTFDIPVRDGAFNITPVTAHKQPRDKIGLREVVGVISRTPVFRVHAFLGNMQVV